MKIVKLTEQTKKDLLRDLLQRSPQSYGSYEAVVAEIVEAVRKDGDKAVFSYTEQFDHIPLSADNINVTREEI